MPIDRARIDVSIRRWIDSLRPHRPSTSSLKAKRIVTDALLRAAAVDRVLYLRDLRRYHFDATIADLAEGLGAAEIERRRLLAEANPSTAQRQRVEIYPAGGPRSGRSPATLVADRRHLRQFVEYCQANNWIAQSFRPFPPNDKGTGRTADGHDDAPENRPVIAYNDWQGLLDTAGSIHPRTRILVAMGLLWGRRVSEAAMLQWGHINSTAGPVDRAGLALSYRAAEVRPGQAVIRNVKRRRTIAIPIGAPMQAELDRWREWLEKSHNQVRLDWYVVPPRVQASVGGFVRVPHEWPVVPAKRATTVALIKDVQRTLTAFGWRDVRREGMHTLRRSVAVHLDGIGEIAAAQALLDHMHRSTTELYTLNRAGESELNALMSRDSPYER